MKQMSTIHKLQEEEYKFPYHYLDLHSDFYSRVRHRINYSILKIVKEALQPFNGQSILDAGCGDGRLCYELRNENVNIVGVDHSQRAIAFAKAFNPSVEFHVADLANFCIDRKVTYITLIEVLEHIPPEQVPIVILNLWEAIEDNGRLIVTVPTINVAVSAKHYQHFTIETLEQLFKPLFEPIKLSGLFRTGKVERYCDFLRKCATFVWFLRNYVPGIYGILNLIDRYYDKNFERCGLEEAGGFMVIFKKIDSIK